LYRRRLASMQKGNAMNKKNFWDELFKMLAALCHRR
jgi:hypothetical protein